MQSVARVLAPFFISVAIAVVGAQQAQDSQPEIGGRDRFAGRASRGQNQVPPRDTSRAQTGTARIRGRVLAADSSGALRRAQVRLTSTTTRTAKVATTDSDGQYEFSELPAGRYTLTVSKAGYVTLQYGQRRPLEPGKPIDVADGQAIDRLDVMLPRGGVIAGRILDEYGEPLAEVTVQALRYQYLGGQRQLVPAGRTAQSDDIGQYRVFGLPPGDYYIAASARTVRGAFQFAGGSVAVLPPSAGPVFGGAAIEPLQVAPDALIGSEDQPTGYAPTYYPGSSTLSDAQRVTIGVGEEMPGVSFSMTVAKLARVSGTVVDSQGQLISRGIVMLRPSRGGPLFMRGETAGPINGGAFILNGVPPGDYVLQARTGPGGRGQAGRGEIEIANVQISVSGSDIAGLVVATTRGATVSGRIAFAGGRSPTLSSMQVTAVPTEPDHTPFGPGRLIARVSDDGTFEFRGLAGANLFRIGNEPSGWILNAVRLDGADVTDTPREFRGGETVTGLEIELTNQATRINGIVTNGQNQSVKEYAVVIFSEDSERWMPQSRFVRAARPDQDGQFHVIGLPPGRYLAVGLDYLEQGSEMDPDLLNQLRNKATSFTLRAGETHQLDLKLSL